MRAGDIYTIAGNGEYSGDGGPAVKAGLSPEPATAQPGCGPHAEQGHLCHGRLLIRPDATCAKSAVWSVCPAADRVPLAGRL
jgi:hypothetical protein